MASILDAATAMVAAFDFLSPAERRDFGRQLIEADRDGNKIGILGVLGSVLANPSAFRQLRSALASAVDRGEAAPIAAGLSDDVPWRTVRAALLAAEGPTEADRHPWGTDPRLLWPLGGA